jgi:hypothetical protein
LLSWVISAQKRHSADASFGRLRAMSAAVRAALAGYRVAIGYARVRPFAVIRTAILHGLTH